MTQIAEPNRDRWGRPLIVPPGGGKPIAYTRVSKAAGLAEDDGNLTRWKMRMVAHGLGKKPDLVALAVALDPNADKSKLNDVAEQALAAANSAEGANLGTALHSFTEWADQGRDLSGVPVELRKLIEMYRDVVRATNLESVEMERFVVNDDLQMAGSFDRIYRHPKFGQVIGDIKTGQHDANYPAKVAIQCAIYANSVYYNPATGERTPIEGLNRSRGILLHLNRVGETCEAIPLDLALGWREAQVAFAVQQHRRLRPADYLPGWA